MKLLKEHLSDNHADVNIAKMIWVAIAFVVGAIILIMVTSAFQTPIHDWFQHVVDSWFKPQNGEFSMVQGNAQGANNTSGGFFGDIDP